MDSDDDQITRKQATKKTKGRKKSTTAKATKTANKKTKPNNSKNKRVRGFLDSDTDDDQPEIDSPTKKLKSNSPLNSTNTTQINTNLVKSESSDDLFKMDDNAVTDLSTPSISTQIFTATSRLNIPLHENKPLNWSHKVNLIGSKSLDQRVQLCDLCKEPILYFGRLISCKHVFCFDCATDLKEKGNNCLRCNEKITRIERNSLNSVYMCNFDKQCKRTYLR